MSQQYRIIADGAAGPVLAALPAAVWAHAAQVAEERGLCVRLERRLVADVGMRAYFDGGTLPAGWLALGDQVVAPWETWADVDGRQG